MYCFTYANNFNCVLNELLLWSEISSEHPIFIKTVAELTNKNLSESTLKNLAEIHEMFSNLKKQLNTISKISYYTPSLFMEVKKMIQEFLIHDEHFLHLLPEVKKYGQEDKVWQTLLEHITDEQTFMHQLFTNLNNQ